MTRKRMDRLRVDLGRRGFSLIEVMIVVAILGVMAALAIPTLAGGSADERLKENVRDVAGFMSYARSEAIRTGEVHIVYVGFDAQAALLPILNGANADAVLVNDGTIGSANQNCRIDPGEVVDWMNANAGVQLGVLPGVVAMPSDGGNAGNIAGGSTFIQPDGTPATWVAFRPEGTAHNFDNATAGCNMGAVGSGAGAFYVNNGVKQFGVALRPLGNTRVRLWEVGVTAWAN